MKLALQINHKPNASSFQPGDWVRGTLEIRGCLFKHLPRITATLWGRLKVKVSPEGNGCCPNEYHHMLFELSKQLEISNSTVVKDKPSSCVYLCLVEFKFPTSVSCACADNCQLPSTISINDGKLQIKSTYSVSVRVERRVIGKVTRTNRVKREVPFSCNPVIQNLPALCAVSIAVEKLSQSGKLASREPTGIHHHECLPSYSPSLQMEIILPQPPVLIRGHGTPVRLVLHTPRELIQTATIYVRSVELQLKASISALSRSTWQNMTENRRGNTIHGAVPIRFENFELELGPWGMFMATQSQPSLNSCLLKLAYSLEVITGLSNGLEGPIQYLKASLDVLVMDPPPSYEAALPDAL